MRVAMPDNAGDAPLSLIPLLYAPEIGPVASELSRVTYEHSKLSLREFEAARMVTAYLNGCQLCQNWRSAADLPIYLKSIGGGDSHTVAENGSVPDEAFYQATASWQQSELFTPRERIAMEFAERMGTEPKELAKDEDFWARAKALFTDAEIIDLSYCTATWMALGRMTHVLGIDAVCGLPTLRAAA